MDRIELVMKIGQLLDDLFDYDDNGSEMLHYMSVYRKYEKQVNNDPYSILRIASDKELGQYYNDIIAALDDLDIASDNYLYNKYL